VESPSSTAATTPGFLSLPQMRYPNEYVWFLFLSSMDVMLTWAILTRGGREVNPVAKEVIFEWGLPGAIGFKFALMLFVIVSCEVIGRQRDRLARNVAQIAIVLSALPVAYSLLLLVWHTYAVGVR
jgi:hypothetical protein